MLNELNIPISQINQIKEGADFLAEDGTVYDNEKVTSPGPKSWTYAFCSDTVYSEKIVASVPTVVL